MSCTEEDPRRSLLPVWELESTTDETVWDTRGEIWATIWATKSEEEEEEEEEEESGLRIRRESCPEEREDDDCPEDREDDWSKVEEKVEGCPEVEEKEEDVCPATAVETVSDIRGRIWERIVSIKDESSIEEEDPEERFEDPDNDDDNEEERLDDPEELEEIPVKGLEEDPEDKLEDEVPEKDEELEEDPEETEAGLGTISTKPGCSVLSSV